ncbi:AGR377Cp [Eremothecium gossypii ATCC 10895]|uniref:AGR377Cp n=1 Tax=Eremothecium gossypii (strain ATCC 10895 / CBS 109.51 / FGSC 9923 / NRRL Y-1056) TaxID=284811 RepID=Q74Z29_EREGS|nr:AGR377Cp [Eremothecium gossypii ATCC 10895]AAS54867.1 AGR377Cp [Eremothecium gossypii ATCC 10895]AEY99199.1 FAGR377Cp [Eremothecium gossypii FDAG1]
MKKQVVLGMAAAAAAAGETMRWEVAPRKVGREVYECVRWEAGRAGALSVRVRRTDRVGHAVDEARFGPTSVQLGRQQLGLEVWDTEANVLVRDRRVPAHGRTVRFSANPAQQVDVCLINVSRDASWRAIDTVAAVEVAVHADAGRVPLTEDDMAVLAAVERDTRAQQTADAVLGSEHVRRDLNESTYTWVVVRPAMLALMLLAAYCMAVPAALLVLARGQRRQKCVE